jgi:hypothetical protein
MLEDCGQFSYDSIAIVDDAVIEDDDRIDLPCVFKEN